MFYEIFEELCYRHHTSPSKVCTELGMSKTTSSFWKRTGGIPKRESLEKIAERFNVSVDFLLGKSDLTDFKQVYQSYEASKNAPIQTNRSEMFSILSQLTDAELDELLHYAEFLLSKRSNQAEPNNQ